MWLCWWEIFVHIKSWASSSHMVILLEEIVSNQSLAWSRKEKVNNLSLIPLQDKPLIFIYSTNLKERYNMLTRVFGGRSLKTYISSHLNKPSFNSKLFALTQLALFQVSMSELLVEDGLWIDFRVFYTPPESSILDSRDNVKSTNIVSLKRPQLTLTLNH